MRMLSFEPEKLRKELKVLRDIQNLSSGTINTIVHEFNGQSVRDYDTLDRVQQQWATWVSELAETEPAGFKNWQEAWKAWAPNHLQNVLVKRGSKMSKSRIETAIDLIAQETSKSIFPVRYESGQIVAASSQWLLRANREVGTTPLASAERDTLLKLVTKLLNQNQSMIEQALQK